MLVRPSHQVVPLSSFLLKAEQKSLVDSGCITTSQELLLQTHSLNPLLELLPPNAPSKTIFLTISSQSLSSLSASLSSPLPLSTLLHRLHTFLPSIGIAHTADVTFARHISLSETIREFEERKAGADKGGLPMLASACPGWICYAEKAHGEVLEKVGRGRSAMGVMGALVKGWWARKHAIEFVQSYFLFLLRGKANASSCNDSPKEIYHVSIQPCYDRKLESSRTQFISSLTSQPETDLVLTTGELDSFLRERGFDALQPTAHETSGRPLPAEYEGFPSLVDHPGSSSDAYLHALLYHFIGRYPPNSLTLATTPIRGSPDYIEYALTVSASADGLPPPNTSIFRAAKCYGFKNLQNVVRKAKTAAGGPTAGGAVSRFARQAASKTYDYVEVMACPSGCVNGGGQLKPVSLTATATMTSAPKRDEEGFVRPWEERDKAMAQVTDGGVDAEMRWSTKEWVARVESIYWGDEPAVDKVPPAALRPEKQLAVGLRMDVGRQRADELESEVRKEMDGHALGWTRTEYAAVAPEGDGLLLGSGVVW